MKSIVKFHSLSAVIIILIIGGCLNDSIREIHTPQFSTFQNLKITDIQPDGWLKEFLERQRTGLTGNIEVAGYPFNTKMWATKKIKGSSRDWWPYEQTAYYIDGVHRLGLLLNDEDLIQKAKVQMQYVMNHIDEKTGRMNTKLSDRLWRWPYANFFRIYMTEYKETGDQAIIDALHRHYLTFDESDFANDVELANLEELCWLYGITRDEKLLEMAEKAYGLFNSNIEFRNREGTDINFSSARVPDYHAVAYLELLKIPAILYSHTGKQVYLDDALNGIQKMEKYHMLASGLPSSTEYFGGQSELSGSETCNTAVFPNTYGYFLRITGDASFGDKIEKAVFNGGIGSVTKDFKSHQYFSSPNQFIATSTSSPYGYHPARMAFLPGHDVECCTGNVNRFMPYYVEQMWMRAPDNGLVATLLGPSTVATIVGKENVKISISEVTNYPFSESIDFKVQTKEDVQFPLYIRIPTWCKNPRILVNGEANTEFISSGTFYKLDRLFRNGDVVSLNIPMEIEISNWPSNGIAFNRGPLTFSLSIKNDKTVLEGYERSTETFPGWELVPTSDWNYAVSLPDGDVEVILDESRTYPWDEGNSPIKLKVPAKKLIDWELTEVFDEQRQMNVVRTPSFPEKIETDEEVEYIELVPYGSSLLRITVFPNISPQ